MSKLDARYDNDRCVIDEARRLHSLGDAPDAEVRLWLCCHLAESKRMRDALDQDAAARDMAAGGSHGHARDTIGTPPRKLYATAAEACEDSNAGGGWGDAVSIAKITRTETVDHVDLGGFAHCACSACLDKYAGRTGDYAPGNDS